MSVITPHFKNCSNSNIFYSINGLGLGFWANFFKVFDEIREFHVLIYYLGLNPCATKVLAFFLYLFSALPKIRISDYFTASFVFLF